jgi:hypothetical protein
LYLKEWSDKFVAGDYKAYDKKMTPDLILAAGKILKAVCVRAGYSEEQLQVVETLMYDIAFPVMNFDGDLVMTCGAEPSGHPLTVIVNSIVGSLLMRMAYINLQTKRSFKEDVHLLVYGDDNLCATKEEAFNHTYISEFLATQGMIYTMADKSSESRPFVTFDECSFLKRTFRFHPELNSFVGPLDNSSLDKMLMYHIPSGAVSEENWAVEVLSTRCREKFFHGKEAFEAARTWSLELVEKLDLQVCVRKSDFPTFDQLVDWYVEKLPSAVACGSLLDDENCLSYLDDGEIEIQDGEFNEDGLSYFRGFVVLYLFSLMRNFFCNRQLLILRNLVAFWIVLVCWGLAHVVWSNSFLYYFLVSGDLFLLLCQIAALCVEGIQILIAFLQLISFVVTISLFYLTRSSRFLIYVGILSLVSGEAQIQCGTFLAEEDIFCPKCQQIDCLFEATDRIVCRRCKHCRPALPCDFDRWFLGCMYCEIEYPLVCDCCKKTPLHAQVYDWDGVTTFFYCKKCFLMYHERSSYTVLKKQSNGSYLRDPVRRPSKRTWLQIRNEDFSPSDGSAMDFEL